MQSAESKLPADILARASLRGNEYAWPVDQIPKVVEAARVANLVNVGGQLQFRLPDGATCECYWVEVDTPRSVPENLRWSDRVTQTAVAALADFYALCERYDFIAEGRTSFPAELGELSDEAVRSAMCFVWYLTSAENEGVAA